MPQRTCCKTSCRRATISACCLLTIAVASCYLALCHGRSPQSLVAASVGFSQKPEEVLIVTGKLPSNKHFSAHLGGFCFGASLSHGHVGELNVTLTAATMDDIAFEGLWTRGTSLWLAFYDDEPKHWPLVRDGWDTYSCETKKSLAVATQEISTTPYTTFSVAISESDGRHGHAVVLSCPISEGSAELRRFWDAPHRTQHAQKQHWPPVRFELRASKALSSFAPGETHPDACPADLWVAAKRQVFKFLTA